MANDANLDGIEAFCLAIIKIRDSFFLAQLGHEFPTRIGDQEKRSAVLLLKVFSMCAQSERPRYARTDGIYGSAGNHFGTRRRSHYWRFLGLSTQTEK